MQIIKNAEKIGACFPVGFAKSESVKGFASIRFSWAGFMGAAVGLAVLLISPLHAATVGVIPVTPEVAPLGDVLTAALSGLTNVVVLERAEIQKVIREQELSLTQPAAVLQAGRLLKAEGLVMLEKRAATPTNDVLSVRVVAIAPGVVILADEFALPFSDVSEWANTYATRLQRVLPRLNVRLEEAVPVSIGSLRSSVPTAEGMNLEQELTTLLRLRLAQEPTVFVLERRNMDALQTEKDLGTVDEPFWNGAFVLDGTINRESVGPTRVTIDLRLAAPRLVATEIHVTGNRESLPALINNLVANFLVSLGKKGTVTTWQPEAEAEKFLQEAQWAARWGLWQQVKESADASWVLGARTRLVAAYRVVSRASLALGMRGYLGWEPSDEYGFHPPPSAEALPMTAQMLELYRHCSQNLLEQTNRLGEGWTSMGIDLLTVSARILDQYYKRTEYREGHEQELRQVRSLARELNGSLMTNSSVWAAGWRHSYEDLPRLPLHTKNGPVRTLPEAWGDAGGVWFDSPREAAAVYRKMLGPPFDYRWVRSLFLEASLPLAGWSAKEREGISSLADGFCQEMAASTNIQTRLDGLRLLFSNSESPDVILTAAEQFVQEVTRSRTTIFRRGLDTPGSLLLTNLLRRIEPWGVPQSKRLEELQAAAAISLNENDPDFSYAIWKDLLAVLTYENVDSFTFRLPPVPPSPERVSELISEIEKIQREKRTRRPVDRYLSQLRAVAGTQQEQSRPPVAQQVNVAATRSPAVLTVSRVWKKDGQAMPAGRFLSYNYPLGNMVWQEGRLWIEAQTSAAEYGSDQPRVALLGFDLTTMRPEVTVSPFESYVSPSEGGAFNDSFRSSLIVGKEIFISVPGAVWHRNSSGEWKQFPVPTSGLPIAWGKSLVVAGRQSIIQLLPETGEVRILASTRRSPPTTALDSLDLSEAALAVWPDNALCASAGGKVWRFDPARNDWRSLLVATNCGESLQLQPQGAFFRQSGQCGGPRFFGGWRPGMANMECYAWIPSGRLGQKVTELFTPPSWKSPDQSAAYNRVAQFEGSGVWIFPTLYRTDLSALELSPPTLLFLDPMVDEALEIEIAFAGRAQEEAGAYQSNRVSFLPTPQGLAILVRKTGTLFWAPQRDVESALAQARQRQNATERIDSPAPARFDRNADGWLNDAERRTMRHDAAWQKELAARIDAARAVALQKHDTEWDNLFASADKNHDGKLSTFEFGGIVTSQPALFTDRLRGHNGQAFQVTRPYDLNNDGALDRPEFKDFMSDPRLPAEVIRSASWVTKFGLKVETCDPNDDGVLDSAERAQVLRLIRQKTGTPQSN